MSTRQSSDKRKAVIDAALDLFVERGFHGAPTSLIAERAGVGVGTIYRYFPSKETLIHSIFEGVHQRFHEKFSDLLKDSSPLEVRLPRFLGRLLTTFIESPRDFRYLEQYHYSPFADLKQSEFPDEEHSALRMLLKEGRDSGLFKNAPLPVLQAIAMGPVVSLVKEHIAGHLVVDDAIVELATQACWETLLK